MLFYLHKFPKTTRTAAFTLIELSIVLVIIGLIAGSVLVGQELIRASVVRATVTQIEKYNQAVNVFRTKYNALPGDMNAATATQFGFTARGGIDGEGDGNGIIEGNWGGYPGNHSGSSENGETITFWADLSKAGLIEGGFNLANPSTILGLLSGTSLDSYFPPAKLGVGNYIYVWSGGPGVANGVAPFGGDGNNYYSISGITSVDDSGYNIGLGVTSGTKNITVAQAYAIDSKVDDGFPQSGNITAMYLIGSGSAWAGATGTTAASASATTCYDNGGNAGTQKYSLAQNNGAGVNCALSFRFQ